MKMNELATHLRKGISNSQHMVITMHSKTQNNVHPMNHKRKRQNGHIYHQRGKKREKGKAHNLIQDIFFVDCDGEYFVGEDWIECDY